jgi:TolB-like protein
MIFLFGGMELNTERFSITRDGQPLPIEPKVFDLLVFLVSHRDRLVTRDQLFEELWPGRVVSDNVLSNEIKLARAVLGDDGKQQKFIRTVRGRGYQFVGDVDEIDATAGRLQVAANITKSPSAPDTGERGSLNPNSIAVLPFENRSKLEDDAFFTDGFHDELITQISRIRGLATISRTSVMAYRDSSKSLRDIGEELNSANIIEGGVQRAGEQIRINVQLIDAEKDEHVWVEAYTRELSAENVFAIQSEIALTVAAQLKAVLSQQEQQVLSEVPTQNMAALEAYSRGRVSSGLVTSEGYSAAVEQFQQAIDLDPDFAEAHAQLALARMEQVHFGGLPSDIQAALAEPAIERALKLNPELSEAHEALAFLEMLKQNEAASEAAYERAIRLNPNSASALRKIGYMKSWFFAQYQQALTLLNRARLLDPQNHHTLTLSGQVLMELGRFDEARSMLNAAIDSGPDFAQAYTTLGNLCSWKLYRHDEAIKARRKAYFLDPEIPWNVFDLAANYYELGVDDRAAFFYERFLEVGHDEVFSFIARLNLHALRGEHEQEKLLFEEFKLNRSGREPVVRNLWATWEKEPWVDIMLGGFDARYGHPELAVERLETAYPELLAGPKLEDDMMFKLATAYVTALHLCGEKEKAAPLTKKILEVLPSKSRYRWRGIGFADAWLHVSMGDNAKAMQALREWRDLGGCEDLTKTRIFSNSLFDSPEFQTLNDEILADLAEQRANLARMEAAGELAPIPE